MDAPTVSVPSVQYICGPTGSADGAQILDQKLLAALSRRGVAVYPLHPRRQRALRLPLWQGRLPDLAATLSRLRTARADGACIVLSHESFFAIAHRIPVDLMIVHNFMPCFRYPGKSWLEGYYRLGSRSFFGRAFANAAAIVFLSHRDHRYAVTEFPQIADRSHVLPPPPHRIGLGEYRDDVVHMSGSEGWMPKRLSRLTNDERVLITSAGFRIEDFGPRPAPAFGLIPDRFVVGFKLKLMQMLYVGDAIASLSEIREEVLALAPDYPWWLEVASVHEAVAWFSELRADPAWWQHCARPVRARLPDWETMAGAVEEMLNFGARQRAILATGYRE